VPEERGRGRGRGRGRVLRGKTGERTVTTPWQSCRSSASVPSFMAFLSHLSLNLPILPSTGPYLPSNLQPDLFPPFSALLSSHRLFSSSTPPLSNVCTSSMPVARRW